MTRIGKCGEERRISRTEYRKSRQGGLFEALQPLEDRVLLTLTYTTFPIPLVAIVEPQGIATGPDGNLWFTENGSGQIGRVTPAGVVTEFTLPTVPPPAGSPGGAPAEPQRPEAIVAGPDGALWFTTSGALIGRIGTDGTITESAVDGLTTPLTFPGFDADITVGPDGALWFTGVDGKVGRITTAGVVTEFAVPPAPPAAGSSPGTPGAVVDPWAITAGPDGALWFTTSDEHVGRITTAGVVTEFAVPPGGTPGTNLSLGAITTGPDGALWFTGGSVTVGRITTAGVVTEYTDPDLNSESSIIEGPDGNLWFTADSQAIGQVTKIGRITPTGTFKSFDVPGDFSSLADLTPGPDGNLWFTEQEDGATAGQQPAVGKITPAGAPTLFPIAQVTTLDPNLGVDVNRSAITTGPDGALWFTENNAIGRITTAGTIEQFALTPGATPIRITAGPDDTLWFTQRVNDSSRNGYRSSIGRITTAGAITLFPLAAGTDVGDITEGRDGNAWFTENRPTSNGLDNAEAIGRITPEGGITTFAIPIPKGDHPGVSTADAIALGPDGNIWFTGDFDGPKNYHPSFLGRVTARGQVRLFMLPSNSYSSSPITSYGYARNGSSLISGPDGKLWFEGTVKEETLGIARISTRGEVGAASPRSIYAGGNLTRGPNGQVWFPVYGGPLGLATRSGIVVTEDLTGHGATGVTAGPDGNLWFTDGTGSIVRISGLDTPLGGLDGRHRPKHEPDYNRCGRSTTVTRNPQPTFAGVARPGSELTLYAQQQGQNARWRSGRSTPTVPTGRGRSPATTG